MISLFLRSHDEEMAKKCPIEQCQKMFKIQLGKSMRNHLRNLHKIDPGRNSYILEQNKIWTLTMRYLNYFTNIKQSRTAKYVCIVCGLCYLQPANR